jgi:hypothetical protein
MMLKRAMVLSKKNVQKNNNPSSFILRITLKIVFHLKIEEHLTKVFSTLIGSRTLLPSVGRLHIFNLKMIRLHLWRVYQNCNFNTNLRNFFNLISFKQQRKIPNNDAKSNINLEKNDFFGRHLVQSKFCSTWLGIFFEE